MSAAPRIAARLVAVHNLKPPVDVEALLQEYADLQILDWSMECDGLALLSAERREQVFLKANAPARRRRFTAAHELGHVVIPWHVGTLGCTEEPGASAGMEEAEANLFASHLLVPDVFLDPFRDSYVDLDEVLDILAVADVSAQAGIIALRRALLPGYVIHLDALPPIESPGTVVPQGGVRALQESSVRTGRKLHQGKLVTWYQLADASPIVEEPRPSREITNLLKSTLAKLHPDRDVRAMCLSINGIVGGALSAQRVSDPSVIYGVLVQKFTGHPQFGHLLEVSDFHRYLQQKAATIGQSRQGETID
ncbi:hypothetical protein Ssi03_73720 [Sphaerisporangium siamense]|uniref:IrrE N-terminal-like domain-containing protein n=1 Tax=Sphaerisporangium siamense TaxID=795645 RepID=A0A7W7G9X2_9ACTN|nr:ImmA/IrrE family metallo-endopeptidase [Sphaerisporangium siamense]MBB4701080.1 hypothetical protein [Sphaerisporangium siamense]GII89382.1 hypothetical protein Ssi03_73720 [Sphaerisporangium siamense]